MDTLNGSLPTPGLIADLIQQGLQLEGVHRVLHTIRKHLGMDVAFVSRFRDGDRLLEQVDVDGVSVLYPGLSIPLDEGYCAKVVLGQLPELIPDTTEIPEAVGIPETATLGIGAHISVPIRLRSGEVYGTLCCFSAKPDSSLGERDLQMMRAFAEVLASHIEDGAEAAKARDVKVTTVRRAMESLDSPNIVYQPIYGLRSGILTGVECLSRFNPDNSLSPSEWFDLAQEVDLRQELEIRAICRALKTLDSFPAWVYFGVNSSPQTILSGALGEALKNFDLSRIVLEITEHAVVTDYRPLSACLQPLRERGLRLAIDDAGAGYASMRHIVSLQPDVIKLDMSLVHDIDRDTTRRALAKALISFSKETGSLITAEGIETQEELDMLRQLGVDTGQGYFLKEPVALNVACSPALQRYDLRSNQIHLVLPE